MERWSSRTLRGRSGATGAWLVVTTCPVLAGAGAVDALMLTVEVAEQAGLVAGELGAHGVELRDVAASRTAPVRARSRSLTLLRVTSSSSPCCFTVAKMFSTCALTSSRLLRATCVRVLDRLHGGGEVGDLAIGPFAAQDALDTLDRLGRVLVGGKVAAILVEAP